MSELLLFSTMRNSAHHIEWFLNHYRAIGVTQFYIVDNGSEDNTVAILKTHSDVHLEEKPNDSFLASRCGVTWLNELRETYGRHKWCIFVDSDEMLVYPGYPETPLTTLTKKMEALGQRCLVAPMIDMFNADSPFETYMQAQKHPLELFPNYCADQLRIISSDTFPYVGFRGGARTAFFGNELEKLTGNASPNLGKIPLIFAETGLEYVTVHKTELLPPSDLTAALLHFKINGHLKESARLEVERNEHYDGAIEYQAYDNVLRNSDKPNILNLNTWKGVDALIQEGLVCCPPRWRKYLARNGSNSFENEMDEHAHRSDLRLWPATAEALRLACEF